MGRWRPATEQGVPYITAGGFAALEREVRALWTRRRDVVVHLAAAAAEGDRSENAEYQYRKKQLREIDRRISYLERRMPRLNIVSKLPDDHTRVYFGARVELVDASGKHHHYRIVGSDEARPEEGSISVDSPFARVLLGRALDDEVRMDRDDAPTHWQIVAIDYPDPGV